MTDAPASASMVLDLARAGQLLDLNLLQQLHRAHALHLAWVHADGTPVTLTADGDAAALVEAVLGLAAFGQRMRAEAQRAPGQPLERAVREIDALIARGR